MINIFVFGLIIGLNIFGTFFFAGGYYPIVGIIIDCCSIISCIFLAENKWMHYFIRQVINSHNIDRYFARGYANRILVSIAYLVCAIKIGIGIAIFVETGAILFGAFVILIVSGYLFEGRNSGMTISAAWSISKIFIKIYLFLTSWTDKVYEGLIKIEFAVLKIDINEKRKSE